MDLDDVLGIVVLLGSIASLVIGAIMVVDNYRLRRLMKELRADPKTAAVLDQIIREHSDKAE